MHLLQSIVMSLIIPKLMGVEQFGFWQLFIFYTQYAGFVHLGLLDGIYLKEGGKAYGNLDFRLLGVQLKVMILWVSFTMMPFVVFSFFNSDPNRAFVIFASAIFVVVYNTIAYLSYVLQCTNRIKAFSAGRMLDVAFFVSSLLVMLVLRVDYFKPYVITYFFVKILSLVYYTTKTKELWLHIKDSIDKEIVSEIKDNIKIGVTLLASNIASMLVLGFGRYMVDMNWGIEVFSKVSFTLMFVNFFMMFVQQASMVLFPDLRRRNDQQILSIYKRLRNILLYISPLVLIAYAPISLFIRFWLPDYTDAIQYLIFLLPLCCFETKMQLLYNTMFKVLRLERKLLLCNILAVSISVVTILISIYGIQNITAVVVSMLISIMARSIIAEFLISGKLSLDTKSIASNIMYEMALVFAFIFMTIYMSLPIALISYVVIVGIFYLFNINTLKGLIKK